MKVGETIDFLVISRDSKFSKKVSDILSGSVVSFHFAHLSKSLEHHFVKSTVSLVDIKEYSKEDVVSYARKIKNINPMNELVLIIDEDYKGLDEIIKLDGIGAFLSNNTDDLQWKLTMSHIQNKISNSTLVEREYVNKLSTTENSVAKQIIKGLTSTEIAEKLNISPKTVENHRYNMCKKLELPRKNNSLLIFLLNNNSCIKG